MNAYFIDYLLTSINTLLICFVVILILFVSILFFRSSKNNRRSDFIKSDLTMYERIFENALLPACIIDQTGIVIDCNTGAQELFGKTKDQLIGEGLDFISIVLSSPQRLSEFKERIKINQRYSYSSNVVTKDETKELIIRLLQVKGGNNPRYLVNFEEKQQSINEDWILLENRVHRMESITKSGFFVYDLITGGIIWSEGLFNILGINPNERQPDLKFISQFTSEYLNQAQNLLMALKNQQAFNEQMQLLSKDNKLKTVRVQLIHQRNFDLEVNKTVGVFADETEIKKVQNKARTLDTILDSKRIYLVITDKKEKIIASNQLAGQLIDSNKKDFRDNFGDPKDINGKETINFITEKDQNLLAWERLSADTFNTYLGIDLNQINGRS